MNKTRALLVLSLVCAFAAGVALGCLVERMRPPRRHTDRDGSWLARQLDLTAEQQEQMRVIWEELAGTRRESFGAQRKQLREERDQAIRDLFSEEQRDAYEAVLADYERKTAELAEKGRKSMEQAVARTREILTPEQREKYEKMVSRTRAGGKRRMRGTRRRPPGGMGRPLPEPAHEPPDGAPPPGQ